MSRNSPSSLLPFGTTTATHVPAASRLERARVRAHLERAEGILERAGGSVVHPLRRVVRALLLRELRRYRKRDLFPRNLDFAEQTPYFVDAAGTLCAVAHLLELSGEGALVRRIARERNHARVQELADEPRLVAWLRAAGISLTEAAAIQPAYCSRPADCFCTGEMPYPAVLEGTVIGPLDSSTTRVHVSAIHGNTEHYRVGDEALVSSISTAPVGSQVMVPLSAWTEAELHMAEPGVYPGGVVPWDGTYRCFGETGWSPSLNAEQYISAVRGSDCRAYLRSLSPAWTRRTCTEEGACSTAVASGDAQPTSLGILLALLTVLVRRRRRDKPGPANVVAKPR